MFKSQTSQLGTWKLKKHSLEPLSRGFEPLCLFSALSFGTRVEPGTFERGMFRWNLGNLNLYGVPLWDLEPSWNLRSVEPFGEPELYVEALWTLQPFEHWGTRTFKIGTFMWNLIFSFYKAAPANSVEPCGTSTFNRGTFMWSLVEPELLTVEPLCGTLWNLNFWQWNLYVEPCWTWTFNRGTFMWNLVEPQFLTVEPLCGTLWNLFFWQWNL